ncbi:MAG: hypothetical protein LIO37_03275, partial [Clostridiales bacterium]|nr:hypothetical protein [Clostridiales bacterium]
AYLAKIYKRQLRKHFSAPFVNQAAAFYEDASVVTAVMAVVGTQSPDKSHAEAADADKGMKIKAGADACDVAMYEVGEGGIYAALWRMAEESGAGLEIHLRQIPIRQETVEVCEFLDINPYQLLSGGCLLVGTYHAMELLQRLEQERIPAVRIGRATNGNDRILTDDGQVRYLERPQPDSFLRKVAGCESQAEGRIRDVPARAISNN